MTQINNPIWQLICSIYHLSANLENHSMSPKIILLTTLADPLHNDGIELHKELKIVIAIIVHVESAGSHALSLLFGSKANDALLKEYHFRLSNDGM